MRAQSAPRKSSALCLTTYPYSSERSPPSLIITRLLKILLPLLLHHHLLIINLLLLVFLNGSRRALAAVIRPLHPLPFLRQRGLNMRKGFDQSVELLNG